MKRVPELYSRIIILNYQSHRPDGSQILIDTIRADVMQGIWRTGVTIGAGEVHSHLPRQQFLLERGRATCARGTRKLQR